MLTALFSLLYLKKKRQLSLPLPVNPLNKKKNKKKKLSILYPFNLYWLISLSLSACQQLVTGTYAQNQKTPHQSSKLTLSNFNLRVIFQPDSLALLPLFLSLKKKRFTFWLPFSSLLQSKQPSTTSCEFFHSLSNLSLF